MVACVNMTSNVKEAKTNDVGVRDEKGNWPNKSEGAFTIRI